MRSITQQDGFTLIEAMIAIAILIIGILPLFAMQISSIHGNATANNLTAASTRALDQIEQMLAWDSSDARLNDSENVNFTGVNGADVADGFLVSDNFTVYWDSTARQDPGNATQQVGFDIQVHVVWNETGRVKQLTMSITKSM